MIIFIDNKGRIKAVDHNTDSSLTGYELVNENNPFEFWSKSRICAYRVELSPEIVVEVVGTKEETYTDLNGNEVTRIVDVTESHETGKYYLRMMTPYLDTRVLEHIDRLGIQSDNNVENISMVEDYTADLLYEICLIQLGIDDEDIDTLM